MRVEMQKSLTLYAASMDVGSGPPAPLQVGKLPATLLAELLAGLPVPPAEVLLGPRIGEDACAIEVPGGVLVAATDPITFTAQEIGRFSVIVNANDVAVMGVRPRWFLAVILLPSGTTQAMVRESSPACKTAWLTSVPPWSAAIPK